MNNHQLKAYHALTWYEEISPATAMEFAARLPKIRRLALKYDRAQVTECNGGDIESNYAKYLEREAQKFGDWRQYTKHRNDSLKAAKETSARIEAELKQFGRDAGYVFQLGGDPRGFTVRIMKIKDGNKWHDLGEHGTVQQTLTEV